MSILSNLSSKKRTFEVAEPDRKYLAQGIFFIALGTILISCITVTELNLMPRYLLLAAGIILGIFGCFRLLKFHVLPYTPSWRWWTAICGNVSSQIQFPNLQKIVK